MSLIVDLISDKFTVEPVSTGILTTTEHDSLRIWGDCNKWWWYSKGIGGGVKEWLDFFKYSEDEKELYLEQYSPIILAHENEYFEYDIFIEVGIGEKGYNQYIESRGISKETAELFNLEIKFDDVYIPIYSSKRVGTIIRYTNRTPKYKKILIDQQPLFWNGHVFDACRPTFIFEGAWSVMKWQQTLGNQYNFVATLCFGLTNSHFEWLNNLDNVIWVLDNDCDNSGNLLSKVINKRNKIKSNNKNHKIVINKTMPDEMGEENIRKLVEYVNV